MRLIDADRLLDERKMKYYHLRNGDIAVAIIDIKHAPTIEERKKGHWVDDRGRVVDLDSEGCPVESAWCSECGEWLTASDEYPVRGWFCPNCGAKMEVKHEPKNDG